ncbi:MAG: zinc-ribbon domain-containing protein [Oscillospiraceae bacterium]|nr:zinc-ribbon domain-containing protein [Oscillospiraceae bacterium]
MKYCTKCGAELDDNVIFCLYCGNKLSASEAPGQQKVNINDNRVIRKRCMNGHFYDASKYTFCPLCGAMPCEEVQHPVQMQAEPVLANKEKKGLFRKQKNTPVPEQVRNIPVASSPYNQAGMVQGGMMDQNLVRVDTGKTVAVFADDFSKEPVVGWIVAVEGEHRGEAYQLVTGKNRIGRNTGNDIIIPNDNTISKVDHAIIVYEPKKHIFILQAGNGNGLTYLNEEIVLESKVLSNYDTLQIGSQVFRFIAFCGDNFSWE